MSEQKDTLNLVVIGPKHAGKTVYLTALANSPEVSLSDPATIEIISMHWQTMQGGDIPAATAGAISKFDFSFHCKIDSKEYNLDFTTPDYDGHFAETLSGSDPNSQDVARLRQIIAEADGFIVFMPVGDEDVQTMEAMRHEIGSFIGILREIFDENSKIPAPLIIAVNKWDKSPDFKKENEDAAALQYLESVEIYKKLYDQLRNFFAHVTVMAVSAYGHRTEDAKPIPGKMEPYRVTEPVMLVVQDYFANLHERIKNLEDNAPALAETLAATRPLWKRLSGCDYDVLLEESLNKCFAELTAQLKNAHNTREFTQILEQSPQGRLMSDFSAEQRIEIEHLGEPHRKREKQERRKRVGIIAGAAIIVCLGWYFIDLNMEIEKDWAQAANAEIQKQPELLSGFVAKYETNAVSRTMASGELEQARDKLRNIAANLQGIIDERLTSFESANDSCKVAEEAKQLINISGQMRQSISARSIRRLEAALESSGEICQARTAIEASHDEASLEEAVRLLANKPETEETTKLKALIAQAREKGRAASVDEEFRNLSGNNLDDIKKFISTYENDSNGDVQNIVARARDLLPQVFYTDIMERIKEVANTKDAAFESLKGLVKNNIQDIVLTPPQIDNIRQALQARLEEADKKAIANLPYKITSQMHLDGALASLAEIEKARHDKLDGGLFEYSVPDELERELANKVRKLRIYQDAIENGVNAHWTLHAMEQNAVDLDCENLIMRDARLKINFSGGSMPNQEPQDNTLRCKRNDGGGYDFYFNGPVRLFNGTIFLVKDRLWRSELKCAAGLTISANDLIELLNGLSVTKSLDHNCSGTSISFSSGSAR